MSIDFYSESVTPEVPAKRNWLFPVILSILLGGAVLGLYLANRPPGLTRGVWVFDGDAMRVVLDFDSTSGLISGSIHEVNFSRTSSLLYSLTPVS